MRNKEALSETIRASMERHAVPGVALGIYDGGEELTERDLEEISPPHDWWRFGLGGEAAG